MERPLFAARRRHHSFSGSACEGVIQGMSEGSSTRRSTIGVYIESQDVAYRPLIEAAFILPHKEMTMPRESFRERM